MSITERDMRENRVYIVVDNAMVILGHFIIATRRAESIVHNSECNVEVPKNVMPNSPPRRTQQGKKTKHDSAEELCK